MTIPIINQSDHKARFRVEAIDYASVCHFEFQVPGSGVNQAKQIEFWVPPGDIADVAVHISPPAPPLISLNPSTYHFTLTTTMLSGTHPTRTVLGQLQKPPIIGPWALSLFLFCLVIIGLFTFDYVINQAVNEPQFETAWQSDPSPALTELDSSTLAATPLVQSDGDPNPPDAAHLHPYEAIFREIGPQYDLDWHLLAEMAYQESRMNPVALGRDNDMGLMQIIPSTWNEWAPKVGVSDPFDPHSNVLVAAAYLAFVRDYARAKGYHEEYWMIVGYNWGPNNLQLLFEKNEGWAQIPEQQRRYALEILQARSSGVNRWQPASP